LLRATLYQTSIKPPLGTINVVDYLLGATLYQASIKPPLGTINVVDYLLGNTISISDDVCDISNCNMTCAISGFIITSLLLIDHMHFI
jgi:hypothetical protein